MFRCSRPLASLGSVWTQRSQLLFATDPHLPVQSNYLTLTDPYLFVKSDYLSLRQIWERNLRTLCEVSLWALPRPHAERRNHWRWSDSPHDLRISLDGLNRHSLRTTFSSLSVPFQVSVERAVPSQAEATLLEQLSRMNRQKPAHGSDLSKCLSENLLLGESLSSTSKLTRGHALAAGRVGGNPPLCRGLFHRDLSSRCAGAALRPRGAAPRQGLSLGQSRRLHQTLAGAVLSAENEARCRRVLQPNAAVYERERERAGRGQRGWAAVLVSLCSVEGEPAFLFTLRSSTLKGRHKGDVSFAGGKQDPSDRDVVDTALREAREELGVAVAASSVWGTLKPLRDMSGMLIAPVLANLGPLEALSFRPNPSEVEEVFSVSLAHVCSPKNRGYTNYRVGERYGYTTPVFLNTKHRVWGLTAVALDHTLKIIVPP
ncbi:nucleoside diphosphate-linked moiety X motif 8 isoform X2 [Conger conger]|nr:nucleoside diphosphate-linked moiety X motif 8 isoform X2 [Conger conger]XP_061073839.1 nucleoside diphosphate-linked moiety X motif 8 isoform X2 [Conger conger]